MPHVTNPTTHAGQKSCAQDGGHDERLHAREPMGLSVGLGKDLPGRAPGGRMLNATARP